MDKKQMKPGFSAEVGDRAVRMVGEHRVDHASQWAAIVSIAAKIGCSAQTLHGWVGKAEVDSGAKPGITAGMSEKVKALEREVRELRQANEILRKAPACFAHPSANTAELDRPFRK